MENVKLRRRHDLTGLRFGRLKIISASENKTVSRGMKWFCQCDCGNTKDVAALALKSGATVSCGCYNKEVNSKRAIHGHNRSKREKTGTYKSWDKMIQRCTNKNTPGYKWYGDKGISICIRWMSFENFLEDMGERPSGMSIDRIDVNGNYEPANCKWSTAKEQANNTTRNVIITFNEESLTVSQWADKLGLKYDTLYYRLFRYNMPLEKALCSDNYAGYPIRVKPISAKAK